MMIDMLYQILLIPVSLCHCELASGASCVRHSSVTPPRELWVWLDGHRDASPSRSLPLSEAKGSGLRLTQGDTSWQIKLTLMEATLAVTLEADARSPID